MRNELLDRVALILMARDELMGKSDAIWLADGLISQLNLIQEVRHIGKTTEHRYVTPWKKI